MEGIKSHESPLLRETLYSLRTSRGLNVHVLPRTGFTKKHATLSVNYGAVDTNFVDPGSGKEVLSPAGIAHFLEHKMFEHEDENAFAEFARHGASANAFTDYTGTTYLFSTTQDFEQSLGTLLSFVQEPYFTDETVEKEKGIITQELIMYEDMPMVKADMNLLRSLYSHSPVRVDIGGTPDSIKDVTKELLYTCYNAFYRPENMVLFVTGDVVPERVFEQVEDDQAKRPVLPAGPVTRIYPDEPEAVNRRYSEETMVVSSPLVLIGIKDPRRFLSGADLLRQQAAGDVLFSSLFGKSSHAYHRLYEAQLINERFAADYDTEVMYSHVVIGGETKDPEKLAEEVRRTLSDAMCAGIDPSDVERLKRSAAGGFVSLFNHMEPVAQLFNSVYFKGAGLFECYDVLRQISVDEVNKALKEIMNPDRIAISLVKP